MSRFDYDGDGEGMPWELWQATVSSALGGRRGQEALAELEAALLELPEPKLIEGHLAADGAVCAVGAFVARRRAKREGIDLQAVIEAMSVGVQCYCGHSREQHNGETCGGTHGWTDKRPCTCTAYEPDPDTEEAWETANAGKAAGMTFTVAYHLAYLNDEKFAEATPEERYEQMLSWVRRAQGKLEGTPA